MSNAPIVLRTNDPPILLRDVFDDLTPVIELLERSGPAHTDNPRFQGRDRSNTPMCLLRSMFWSGLFDRWAIAQATSIGRLNEVEGSDLDLRRGLTFTRRAEGVHAVAAAHPNGGVHPDEGRLPQTGEI